MSQMALPRRPSRSCARTTSRIGIAGGARPATSTRRTVRAGGHRREAVRAAAREVAVVGLEAREGLPKRPSPRPSTSRRTKRPRRVALARARRARGREHRSSRSGMTRTGCARNASTRLSGLGAVALVSSVAPHALARRESATLLVAEQVSRRWCQDVRGLRRSQASGTSRWFCRLIVQLW